MRENDRGFAKRRTCFPKHTWLTSIYRRHFRWLYYHPKLQKVQGYHFGILCCAGLSAAVLLVNVVLTIWATKRYGVHGGLGTVRDGECNQVKNLAMWLHLGINILSTLLLGASSHTMQCLSAPTRHDVDRAHGQGFWLNIGTSSVRNLRRIPTYRTLLWMVVATSSVPLYLMYNSAIFTTISVPEYNVILVSTDFLTEAPFALDSGPLSANPECSSAHKAEKTSNITYAAQRLRSQALSGNLSRLENDMCIQAYSGIVTAYADVLVMTAWHNSTNSILYYWSSILPQFSANSPEEVSWITYTNDGTAPEDGIEYCLSQPAVEHCKVQFSTTIMMTVCVCNLCKFIVISYIAWRRPPEPMLTLGDALQSFLKGPDQTTGGNCLAGEEHFHRIGPTILPVELGSHMYEDLHGFNNDRCREKGSMKHSHCLACESDATNFDHRIERSLAYNVAARYWSRAPGVLRWILFFIL